MIPGFIVRRPRRLALYGLKLSVNGRQRFFSIGTEADFTPDQARAEAEKLRAAKRQGIDLAATRDRRKTSPTIEAAANRFILDHVSAKLRARTAQHYREMLDRLILPHFGTWRLDAVTIADVAQWHAGLRGTPYQGNRALAILSSLMSWARRCGLVLTDNPCKDVAHFDEQPVNRYPTPAQIARILAAADELAAENHISPFFAAGLRVLALTGARRSEIFDARWEWLDIARSDLVLPNSKTGAKRVTLPAEALRAIQCLPRIAGSPHIFPSLKPGLPYCNFSHAWPKVLARADVGHWRMHDIRHAFASAAVEGGASLFTVAKLLGHAHTQTTERYSHLGDDPRRTVAEAVSVAIVGKL